MSEPQAQREICLACYKATAQCICDAVVPVSHKTLLTIIQHPRERTHPFGTVRMARLALEHVWVESFGPRESWADERARTIEAAIQARAQDGRTALLYPGPDARLITDLRDDEVPTQLIVLDGTWSHAKKLYDALPFLHTLPKVALQPERPSEYQIRREPDASCLSTIEAITYALQELEPHNPQVPRLLHPFRTLIQRQLALRHQRRPAPRQIKACPSPPYHSWMPPALRSASADVVVVAVESVKAHTEAGTRHEVVALLAQRISTGERFVRYMRPRHTTIADWQYECFGVPSQAFAPATERDAILRKWRAFLGPSATLVTWHANTQAQLQSLAPDTAHHQPTTLSLKGIYANAQQDTPGHLHEAVAREGLALQPNGIAGRGGVQLAQVAAMLEHLRERYRLQERKDTPPQKGNNPDEL